jgi:hypothetical protein
MISTASIERSRATARITRIMPRNTTVQERRGPREQAQAGLGISGSDLSGFWSSGFIILPPKMIFLTAGIYF